MLELMNLLEFNGRALEKWKEKTASSEFEMKDVQRFISEDSELNGVRLGFWQLYNTAFPAKINCFIIFSISISEPWTSALPTRNSIAR